MVKRTLEEKQAAALAITTLQATPEYKIYHREVMRIKDAIASGAYRESGEQLVKTVGIIHGIDLALGIVDMISTKDK